ncbi:hypothetical protein [Microbulbifer variabilis]|uniref:hypothetical protein n=1 Tax=Microbulbifer variabilis TaxID=266805 RepID=UPI001CFF38F4|nr:hypothetical protein [Microbulbifer variabilis]
MTTDREIANYWYNELIEGLRLISSDFEVQEKSLPDFVHLPDEVLNAVSLDTLGLVVEFGLLSKEEFAQVTLLDNALESITLPLDYEEMIQQMKSGDDFKHLRKLARKVLDSLGQPYKEPSISATYIKGS